MITRLVRCLSRPALLTLLLLGLGRSDSAAQSGGTVTDTGPLVKIYFTDGGVDITGSGVGSVKCVNSDGTGLTTLVAPAGYRPRGIVLDDVNGKLYWNDFGQVQNPVLNPGGTWQSNVDGSGATLIIDHGTAGVNDIDVDPVAGAGPAQGEPVVPDTRHLEIGYAIPKEGACPPARGGRDDKRCPGNDLRGPPVLGRKPRFWSLI